MTLPVPYNNLYLRMKILMVYMAQMFSCPQHEWGDLSAWQMIVDDQALQVGTYPYQASSTDSPPGRAGVGRVDLGLLVYGLWKRRTTKFASVLTQALLRTNEVIQRLVYYVLNTGVANIICSAAVIITFNLMRESLAFAGIIEMRSKLYANVMMALLNSRQILLKNRDIQLPTKPVCTSSLIRSFVMIPMMEKTRTDVNPQKLSRRVDGTLLCLYRSSGRMSSVFITFLDIAWRVTSSLTIIVRLAIAPPREWKFIKKCRVLDHDNKIWRRRSKLSLRIVEDEVQICADFARGGLKHNSLISSQLAPLRRVRNSALSSEITLYSMAYSFAATVGPLLVLLFGIFIAQLYYYYTSFKHDNPYLRIYVWAMGSTDSAWRPPIQCFVWYFSTGTLSLILEIKPMVSTLFIGMCSSSFPAQNSKPETTGIRRSLRATVMLEIVLLAHHACNLNQATVSNGKTRIVVTGVPAFLVFTRFLLGIRYDDRYVLCGTAADAAISAFLSWCLWRKRQNTMQYTRTNDIIQKLVWGILNTATAICSSSSRRLNARNIIFARDIELPALEARKVPATQVHIYTDTIIQGDSNARHAMLLSWQDSDIVSSLLGQELRTREREYSATYSDRYTGSREISGMATSRRGRLRPFVLNAQLDRYNRSQFRCSLAALIQARTRHTTAYQSHKGTSVPQIPVSAPAVLRERRFLPCSQGPEDGLWYEASNPSTSARGLVPVHMFEEFLKGSATPRTPLPTALKRSDTGKPQTFYAVVSMISPQSEQMNWMQSRARCSTTGGGVEAPNNNYKANSISLGVLDEAALAQSPPASASSERKSAAPHSPDINVQGPSPSSHTHQQFPEEPSQPPLLPEGILVSADVKSFHFEMEEYWFRVHAIFQPEAGRQSAGRTLPYMPGPVPHVDNQITVSRRQELDQYLQELCALSEKGVRHVNESALVREFFATKPGDASADIEPQVRYIESLPYEHDTQVNVDTEYGVHDQFSRMRLSGGPDSGYEESDYLGKGHRSSAREYDQRASHQRAESTASMYKNGTSRSMTHSRSSSRNHSVVDYPGGYGHGRNGSSLEIDTFQANGYPRSSIQGRTPSSANPPISSSIPQTAFIKIKIYDKISDDLVAIRVHPRVTHAQLMDKVQARLGDNVMSLRYRDSVNNTLMELTDDEELRLWLDHTDRLVLYLEISRPEDLFYISSTLFVTKHSDLYFSFLDPVPRFFGLLYPSPSASYILSLGKCNLVPLFHVTRKSNSKLWGQVWARAPRHNAEAPGVERPPTISDNYRPVTGRRLRVRRNYHCANHLVIVHNIAYIPNLDPSIIEAIPLRAERPRSPESAGEEQALEWREVIELQEFSERKAWIEEKTRLLEQMPPIEVFVGLDAKSGLPTREELNQWLVEHDKIEKETEIFDSGELRKLKKFTKAAAQRNLSPADTDLIELTLTTIYALDKLLRLLRDRSNRLELLSDRLTWEERRIASWVELLRQRVSSLRHSKITAAGKALDKLIDDSRKPVPDELWTSKINLKTRSRRIYVETARDKSTAQTLLEEIEIAKLSHPRAVKIMHFFPRLKMREDPSSSISVFLRPTHPLFPDQDSANDEISAILTAELASTQEQASEAERAAKEYHAILDRVKKVEALFKTAVDLTTQLESLSHRLETGIESDSGDGSPPTLSSESCLHSNSHSIEKAANDAVSSGRVALAALPRQGIDAQFRQDSIAAFDRLASYRTSAINIRSSVASRVETLRKCRSIWSSMAETFDKGTTTSRRGGSHTEANVQAECQSGCALLTPESPSSVLAVPELTVAQANEQIDGLVSAMGCHYTPCLRHHQSLDELRRLTQSWSQVQIQASEMEAISDEVHALQMRSEHFKLQLDDGAQDILLGTFLPMIYDQGGGAGERIRQLTVDVKTFQDKLSSRIPFVSSGDGLASQCSAGGVPFDTAALDRAVRADANSYSILLAGEIEAVSRSSDHFRWAQQARAVDIAVTGASLNDHLKPIDLATLQSISAKVDDLHRQKGQSLATSYQDVRELLERLESVSSTRDPSYDATVLVPRRQAVEEAKSKLGRWTESIEVLSEQLSDMQHSERVRLEAEAAAIAAAEEAERLHREEERLRMEEEESCVGRKKRGCVERKKRDCAERKRRKGCVGRKGERGCAGGKERDCVKKKRRFCEKSGGGQSKRESYSGGAGGSSSRDGKESAWDGSAGAQRPVEERETRTRRIAKDPQQVTPRTGKGRANPTHRAGSAYGPCISTKQLAHLETDIFFAVPETVDAIKYQLESLQREVETLPASIPTAPYVDAELRSLRSELEASEKMLESICCLAEFGAIVQRCDDLLSDLLEHIDSYPAPPTATLSTLHTSDTSRPPEDQISDRLAFTDKVVQELISHAKPLAGDSRITSECDRITQTWEELQAMGNDRVDGRKSRPPSAMSVGPSRALIAPSPVPPRPKQAEQRKPGPSYSRLSAAPPGSKYLAPPPIPRRSISRESSKAPSRATPHREAGLVHKAIAPVPGPDRAHMSESLRLLWLTCRDLSLVRVYTLLVLSLVPPVGQLGHELLSPPPRKPSSTVKTPYVPNPKNKLDIAVGDVINSLPVNINIEVVAETWKDQSGKYWIGGDDDPKLCFCRILRSQTVMVRVGGGWTELSKFIKEHFADSFRVLPLTESPPHKKAQEEKWISSAILAQAMSDKAQSPPLPPHTPEPQLPFIPSFALSTPSGTSPRTIKTSSPGSPLHAMQFIRRADRDSISSRPETPTRPPRPATSLSHNRKQPIIVTDMNHYSCHLLTRPPTAFGTARQTWGPYYILSLSTSTPHVKLSEGLSEKAVVSFSIQDDVVVCSLILRMTIKHSFWAVPTVYWRYAAGESLHAICAMSFWQYQLHQEHSFQQAVVRSVNEKNAQMQKELHNVVREANGEISLLNNKIAELQRELETERRKSATLQEAVRERDKEYQKLKAQHDKIKRKAILAPENPPATPALATGRAVPQAQASAAGTGIDVGAVVGNMEANGVGGLMLSLQRYR
ncbi:hypothetical protein BC629DRAFT_1440299 [Irpex lacteus]|nr:hypothetical protein BC629DRAFT_1440299 [Irpex lacteus]